MIIVTRNNDENDNSINLNKKEDIEIINPAFSTMNVIDIVERFKQNPIVDPNELLTYMWTLCTFGDFTIYVWNDSMNVNKLWTCVYVGDLSNTSNGEVVYCKLVDNNVTFDEVPYHSNHFMFKTSNNKIIKKLNKIMENIEKHI